MAKQILIAQLVHVHCLAHTGYRRAGMAFVHGENTLEPDSLTETQLAQIQADPMFKVSLSDPKVSQPEGGHSLSKEPLVESGLHTGLTTPDPKTPESLVDAILKLDASNASHFTSSGKPQVDALESLMGTKVTAAERDEAWQQVQDSVAAVEGE
ncbi:HI1506-related protein [Vibrio nigripulchritudo]|uniref:HI1506-related protein n=1 Tax=Vibrio nigripulchritudo TaxID=28173 RepID=UPI0003B1B4AD|nr:HI1506-related protein [Vibrio nigripulchritudo]CCN69784.1 conserved hypothetical protein [Vibrio nigripulchritudo SFn118]